MCPETGRACELDCGLGRVCARIRAVPRCKHGQHPGECGQCLAGSSLLSAGIDIGKHPPGVYRVTIGHRGEVVEVMNITDDMK
ncbi:hypothetical protein [Sphingomonas phage Birtae]|nr:hypothetical protein [Sphingomonas phage Birtae]